MEIIGIILYNIFVNMGKIPMEKNIIVVDEQGNDYDPTYPKRAKGLVKNGRARFISEKKICLACPPNRKLEDLGMVKEKNIIGDDCVVKEKDQILFLVLMRLQIGLKL
jgi:hypothetical protein